MSIKKYSEQYQINEKENIGFQIYWNGKKNQDGKHGKYINLRFQGRSVKIVFSAYNYDETILAL